MNRLPADFSGALDRQRGNFGVTMSTKMSAPDAFSFAICASIECL